MADLRATSVFQGVINGTSVVDLYTVPTGKRLILKHVTALEASGSSCDAQLRSSAAGGTIYVWHLVAYGSGGDDASQSFWIVFNAGDKVQFKRTTSGQLVVTVSGSLHTV